MTFSRDRVFHLISRIMEKLEEEQLNIPEKDRFRGKLTRAFMDELRVLETIDQDVRKRIEHMSKPIAEGSGEWRALYERFFEEEWRRRSKL